MRSTSVVTTRFATSPTFRAVSRWVLGTVGILWVAIAASLCGCSPISPVNGWVMNESGKAYYKRGDHLQARREFERALMDSPKNSDYAFNVASAMDQQGDHLAAETMYRHALTLDPGHQPAYHGLAAMMVHDGRTADADDLLNTWSATQPYSPEASTELGWLKTEQGDLDGADRELRKALRQNPRHSRALAQLGRVHGKSGRRGEAAADYARSLFMDPEQPETQAELASLGNDVYGSPALQMAAAMPMYDPSMQASPYPAFTQSTGQPQMAATQMSDQSWNSSPSPYMSGMQNTSAPMGFSMNQAQGMSYPQPTSQAQWSQPQPQMSLMNGQPAYPSETYPDAVSQTYGSPQQYTTARPTTSFFQPQQSFNGNMPSEQPMMTSAPMPTPDPSFPMQASYNDAPTWNAGQPNMTAPTMVPNRWNTPPAMNASFGNPVPAAQMSSVPVVPAF